MFAAGWGYFGLASQLKLFARLDGWIRRRIRCCYWKQWRRPKTRRRNLIQLGVPRRQAIRHARSRKGPWHMSKTIASGVGMTNQWLEQQGMLSFENSVGGPCSASSNRLVRTRMLGGVGAAVSDGRGYPISSVLSVISHTKAASGPHQHSGLQLPWIEDPLSILGSLHHLPRSMFCRNPRDSPTPDKHSARTPIQSILRTQGISSGASSIAFRISDASSSILSTK